MTDVQVKKERPSSIVQLTDAELDMAAGGRPRIVFIGLTRTAEGPCLTIVRHDEETGETTQTERGRGC